MKSMQENGSIMVVRCGLKILSLGITVRHHEACQALWCRKVTLMMDLHLTTIKDSYSPTSENLSAWIIAWCSVDNQGLYWLFMHTAMALIRLCGCAGQIESSLGALFLCIQSWLLSVCVDVHARLSHHWVHSFHAYNDDFYQTVWMCMLDWVIAGCTVFLHTTMTLIRLCGCAC